MRCENCLYNEICDWFGNFTEDCMRFEDKNVRPPVSIGTILWVVDINNARIEKSKVSLLRQKADKTWSIRVSILPGGKPYDFLSDEIGKTVMLTQETAKVTLYNNLIEAR